MPEMRYGARPLAWKPVVLESMKALCEGVCVCIEKSNPPCSSASSPFLHMCQPP
jgi:hypothetical protein